VKLQLAQRRDGGSPRLHLSHFAAIAFTRNEWWRHEDGRSRMVPAVRTGLTRLDPDLLSRLASDLAAKVRSARRRHRGPDAARRP
jgi:hypothetical protein